MLTNWLKVSPEIRDGVDDSRRRISSIERVGFTKNPRESIALTVDMAKASDGRIMGNGTHATLSQEREFYILCKVVRIFNSLVEGVHSEALDGQVRVWVRETKESVFENNGGAFGNLTIDSPVGEVSPVT